MTPKTLSRRLLIAAALGAVLAGSLVDLSIAGDQLLRPVYYVEAIGASLSAAGFAAVALLTLPKRA